MKSTIEVYYCDICEKEAKVKSIKYPVIFHTETTEGRSRDPYISYEDIDMCEDCEKQALVVHGSGAQGFYDYTIKKE